MFDDEVAEATRDFTRNGFCVSPVLLSPEVLDAACRGVEDVVAGRYETGTEPYARNWGHSERPGEAVSIAEPHRCDRAIRAAVTQPALGAWMAALTGARAIDVVAVDLFYRAASTVGLTNVGWHQDAPFLEGEDEVLTAWLALSEVTTGSAPLLYVRGSHLTGRRTQRADFFETDIGTSRLQTLLPEHDVDVVPTPVPRGAAAIHHRLTVHASGPNTGSVPRMSLAVRMRATRSSAAKEPLPDHELIRIHGPAAPR